MAIPKREMKCCNCGNYAGKFHQHYNRDNGFGICLRCVTDEIKSQGVETALACYGVPGFNYPSVDILTIKQAFTIGQYAKKHGVPENFNPFKFPGITAGALTQFDAYAAGFEGDSWENFSSPKLNVGV
jgi:hypothetical protein